MNRVAQYLVDYFDAGVKIFEAGKHYALTELTRLHILHGHAIEVDAPEGPPADESPAEAKPDAPSDKPARKKA